MGTPAHPHNGRHRDDPLRAAKLDLLGSTQLTLLIHCLCFTDLHQKATFHTEVFNPKQALFSFSVATSCVLFFPHSEHFPRKGHQGAAS